MNNRIDELLNFLYRMAAGDFDINYTVSDQNDSFDALGIGMMMLADQLKNTTTSKELLNQRNQEKEILLKEIHHRVKNNMQVITSLLSLQSNMIENSVIKEQFRLCQHRINTMALVHQMLYQSEDFSQINYCEYLRLLVEKLISSYNGPDKNVRFDLVGEDINLDLDTAVTLGLLVNEIISNSLKHGFTGSSKFTNGTIYIKLEQLQKNKLRILIGDNGVGYANKGNRFKPTDTLGLSLIHRLVLQLKGSIEKIDSDPGTHYDIKISLPDLKKKRKFTDPPKF